MKKFYFIFILLTTFGSCRKGNISIPSPQTPPVPQAPPKQVSGIKVIINDAPMLVDTFNFSRGTNSLDIEAINSTRRVALAVRNFYQTNPFSYVCPYQVFYATRSETMRNWKDYPIDNKNYYLYFNDWMPMKDSIVSGYFTATLLEDKNALDIRADFKLVF